jgi:hypothetical protein
MPKPQSVTDLAYRLWIARGRPCGSAEESWLEAERQLSAGAHTDPEGRVDSPSEAAFPASDPPANNHRHTPTVIPGKKRQSADTSNDKEVTFARSGKRD